VNFVYLEKKKRKRNIPRIFKNPNLWNLKNKIVFLDSRETENISRLFGS